MSKIIPKWIEFDVESLAGTSSLRVFLDGAGGLEKTAGGIRIKASGVTNDMLAGSIGLDKLIKAVIAADGTVAFTGDQAHGGHKITGVQNGTDPQDAVTLSQLETALAGLDFQADVLDVQVDNTLDPGASPATGARYIVTASGNLHVNFGTITGVGDNDIVEYDGVDWIVSYDVTVQGEGAIAWVISEDVFRRWDGTSWDEFGGLSGVTAGDGLAKDGNTLSVVVSDIAGTGIEDDGSNNLRIASSATGNGLTGGSGSVLSVDSDSTTGGDTAPVTVGVNGVGVDVKTLDGDHLDVDFTPANYTPDASPAEADDVDALAAHLKGIDTALASAGGSGSPLHQYLVEITAGMITNGYLTLPSSPVASKTVFVSPVGGAQQINKQTIGGVSVTPDFDVLNTTELHINNNGSATGLSAIFTEGDILMIDYEAAS